MADETPASPISAAEPPVTNPMTSGASEHAATLKLKPVIRKPEAGAAAAGPRSTMDQLRSATQKLKGLTQQIPQQAILHKTGIIAEQALTEAQKQASKSRTARISLSDAIGVAPVKNEATPMKTIRIKRPVDLAKPAAPAPEAAPAAAPEPKTTSTATLAPVAPAPDAAAEKPAEAATVTQRKTLKIARPGAVRPAGKFGVKKPGAPAAAAKPAAAEKPADAPAGDDAIADISDIPEMPATPAQPFGAAADTCPSDRIPDVGKACQIIGLLMQIAACAVMGFLVFRLYEVIQLPAYCGGTMM